MRAKVGPMGPRKKLEGGGGIILRDVTPAVSFKQVSKYLNETIIFVFFYYYYYYYYSFKHVTMFLNETIILVSFLLLLLLWWWLFIQASYNIS